MSEPSRAVSQQSSAGSEPAGLRSPVQGQSPGEQRLTRRSVTVESGRSDEDKDKDSGVMRVSSFKGFGRKSSQVARSITKMASKLGLGRQNSEEVVLGDDEEEQRDRDLVLKQASKARKEAEKIIEDRDRNVGAEERQRKTFENWVRNFSFQRMCYKALGWKYTDPDEYLGVLFTTPEECQMASKMKLNVPAGSSMMDVYCHIQAEVTLHAAAFLDDSFNGRLENGKGKTFYSPLPAWLSFRIHASAAYTNLLKIVALLFCIETIFNEPISFDATAIPATAIFHQQLFEVCCLALFTSDLLLRSVYMGRKNIMKKAPLRVMIAVIAIGWLDVAIALLVPRKYFSLRFSRIFRPLVFLIRDKTSMQLLKTILKIVPRLAPLFALLLALVVGFALVGIQLCTDEVFANGTQQSLADGELAPFGDTVQAMLSLTTLLTLESYNDVLVPYVEGNKWLMVYFLVFLCLGVLVLLNMVIAVQVDVFTVLQRSIVEKAVSKERTTLLVVFNLAKGPFDHVTKNRFRALARAYKPSLSDAVIHRLFKLCDKDKKGHINEVEFLQVCDVLREEYLETIQSGPPSSLQLSLTAITQHTFYRPAVFASVSANTLMVALALTFPPSPSALVAVAMVDHVLALLYCAHLAMCVHVKTSRDYFLEAGNQYTLFSAVVSVVLACVAYSVFGAFSDGFYRCLWVGTALRWFHILNLPVDSLKFTANTQRQLEVLWHVKAPLFDFFKLMGVLLYMFAVLGMELFHGTTYFTSFPRTLRTMLQLANQEDWPTITNETVRQMGSRASCLYFIVFVFLVDIMVLNLLMAVMYSLASRERQRGAKDKKKRQWQREFVGEVEHKHHPSLASVANTVMDMSRVAHKWKRIAADSPKDAKASNTGGKASNAGAKASNAGAKGGDHLGWMHVQFLSRSKDEVIPPGQFALQRQQQREHYGRLGDVAEGEDGGEEGEREGERQDGSSSRQSSAGGSELGFEEIARMLKQGSGIDGDLESDDDNENAARVPMHPDEEEHEAGHEKGE